MDTKFMYGDIIEHRHNRVCPVKLYVVRKNLGNGKLLVSMFNDRGISAVGYRERDVDKVTRSTRTAKKKLFTTWGGGKQFLFVLDK